MQINERPRFLMRRRESGLTSEQVAKEAGLSLADEYRAEIGSVVELEVAERILAAFSRLTDKPWTLAEISINIQKEATL